MADTKISALTGITGGLLADGDEFPVADASDLTATFAATAANIKSYVNANELHSGYSDYTAIANPAVPGAGILRAYARLVSGRTVPRVMPPSGADYSLQAALWGNHIQQVSPATGSTAGSFIGGSLTSGGTVSHPTPTITSRATRMTRLRHANVVTTTNQVLGFHGGSANMAGYLRGNAAGVGGFFFFARFSVALWPAATVRLFVGLRSGTTARVTTDTLSGDLCGFWHDTTMDAVTINFVTRDNSTNSSTAIAVPTLGADVGFIAYIFAKPNDTTIFYRLDRTDTGATIVDTSTTSNLPRNTIFMAPECAMSNGTANITVTTTAIALNKLYIESAY
jgi:hypothetical protein